MIQTLVVTVAADDSAEIDSFDENDEAAETKIGLWWGGVQKSSTPEQEAERESQR